jgi:hypothetical protein
MVESKGVKILMIQEDALESVLDFLGSNPATAGGVIAKGLAERTRYLSEGEVNVLNEFYKAEQEKAKEAEPKYKKKPGRPAKIKKE